MHQKTLTDWIFGSVRRRQNLEHLRIVPIKSLNTWPLFASHFECRTRDRSSALLEGALGDFVVPTIVLAARRDRNVVLEPVVAHYVACVLNCTEA